MMDLIWDFTSPIALLMAPLMSRNTGENDNAAIFFMVKLLSFRFYLKASPTVQDKTKAGSGSSASKASSGSRTVSSAAKSVGMFMFL